MGGFGGGQGGFVGGQMGGGGGGGMGGGFFTVPEETVPQVPVSGPATPAKAQAAPAKADAAKTSDATARPATIPLEKSAADDPKAAWEHYFATQQPLPAAVREAVGKLTAAAEIRAGHRPDRGRLARISNSSPGCMKPWP